MTDHFVRDTDVAADKAVADVNNKATTLLAETPAKPSDVRDRLWEFGKVYLATAGPSATGMADGNSGMAMA
ncbi:MAG: hypothetical protein IPI87_07345 [Betaproteobacteria bacterium]|nr:hypothetical protein [Betaproteobacteria bacterium]